MNTSNMQIRIMGGNVTKVTSPETIEDILDLSEKFGRITNIGKASGIASLTTAVGDLSASVVDGDSREGYAHEVANVLVSTMVIAAAVGVDPEQVRSEISLIISAGTNKAIASIVKETMAKRGAEEVSVSLPFPL